MAFTCDFCNKIISTYSTLYFGFDCLCCSNHCRSQVIEINLNIDSKMNNPHNWLIHKLRKERTIIQSIPKNRSLCDILTQIKI